MATGSGPFPLPCPPVSIRVKEGPFLVVGALAWAAKPGTGIFCRKAASFAEASEPREERERESCTDWHLCASRHTEGGQAVAKRSRWPWLGPCTGRPTPRAGPTASRPAG